MNENENSSARCSALAEEILRTIYGDDLKGCTVSVESISAIIGKGLKQNLPVAELIALYEKVVEAVHALSQPPPAETINDPAELQSLLTKRLDAIHAITTKTMATTSLFKSLG